VVAPERDDEEMQLGEAAEEVSFVRYLVARMSSSGEEVSSARKCFAFRSR
jgi:hypothetical protein